MYPYLFTNTPYEISSWNLLLFIGVFVFVTLLVLKRPKDFPLSRPGILGCSLLMVYLGLVGAKVLYILLHWQSLLKSNLSPINVFATAGYAYFGGLAFTILTILAFAKLRRNRASFLKLADYFAPFVVLHQAFVRIGCFLAGCCHGKTTSLPWGVVFKSWPPVSRHPTQIYSFLFLLFIFFTTRHVYKTGKQPAGVIFFAVLCMYGFFRFWVEFFRIDSFQIIGAITLAQITTLSLAFISALAIWIILIKCIKSAP